MICLEVHSCWGAKRRESIELEVFSSGKLRVSLASYSDRLEKGLKMATKQKECL